MKKFIAVLLGVLLLAFPLAACAAAPGGGHDDGGTAYVDPDLPDGTHEELSAYDPGEFDLDSYMTPVWNDGGVARAESAFVRKEKDGSIAPIKMLYPMKQIVSVRSFGLDVLYEEGKDYSLTPDGKLQINPDGAIKAIDYDKFYIDVYDPTSGSMMPERYGSGAQIYREAILENGEHHAGMTEWQIVVTYRHSALWTGSVPAPQSDRLPRTNTILGSGTAKLKIAVLGDSISQGWTASGYENVDIAPHCPPYAELFAASLKSKFGENKVELKNFSLAGKTSRWPLYEQDGVENFGNMLAYSPDLVVIAFGMNDGVDIAPADYGDNIENIIDRITENNPKTEIVLVSPMLPNAEIRVNWGNRTPILARQPEYKAVLRRIAGERTAVAFADVTSVFQEINKSKRFIDYTSNNVNHPGDYGHRVYAQVLMQTVVGNRLPG